MFEFLDILHQKANNTLNYICFGAIGIAGLLLISSMVRFLFGKKNQLGKAITSAMEILCLYVIWTAIYCFGLHWKVFLSPLPFLSLEHNCLNIFPILSAPFQEICVPFLKLLMIAFLVNLMNSVIPEGKRLFIWLIMRICAVVLALGLNYVLDLALGIWFPQSFWQNASWVLLGVLVLLIALGSLKMIVGAALFVTNPLIGALYTFFFSNLIGRSLARSILSAGLVTGLVCLMNSLGILSIAVSAASLLALIPAFAIIVLLWYAIDRIV